MSGLELARPVFFNAIHLWIFFTGNNARLYKARARNWANQKPRSMMMSKRVRVPGSLTEHAQLTCQQHEKRHLAFKVIPLDRVNPGVLRATRDTYEWGTTLLLTGGFLGAVVVPDLARITPAHAVYYVEWMLGGEHLITSVAVRSKGDAERFPRDQLMVEHAPSLADGSLGAHVFHFFDGREASMFQFLLCSEISRRSE